MEDVNSKNRAAVSRLVLELLTDDQDERSIYVTGNFNNWEIGEDRFKLQKVSPGKYFIEFPEDVTLPEPLEYKYIRKDWDGVELNEYGNFVPNRILKTTKGFIQDYVPRWQRSLSYTEDFLPKVQTIAEDFEIPQLFKTRRISALLPYDYDKTDKQYPVLYLQDGQNLYDEYAPYGNWGLDKRLAKMALNGTHEIIVIAIDHAMEDRIGEFTPSYKTKLGAGDGKKYVRFLADTLKPYVDKKFRTLPERENTGIGGSSMGGLISIYAGLLYPEEYGKLMIFSPSLWVAPNIHFQTMGMDNAYKTKIYLYGGGQEGANLIPNIQRFKGALERNGHHDDSMIEFKLSIDPHGKHNEDNWGEEFPHAIKWLFF